MPHLEPRPRHELASDTEQLLQLVEGAMGFVPNSMLTMARRPALLDAFGRFAATVQLGAGVDPVLLQLVAHVASTAAGCRYCQAHTASTAARRGASEEKIAAVWEFESSALFTDAERAALRLARDAAQVPNATTPAHFDDLRRHFDDEEIIDLVAMVSLFGFLNRWNDTMATALEDEPRAFADAHLATRGWQPGKHS